MVNNVAFKLASSILEIRQFLQSHFDYLKNRDYDKYE